MEIASKNYFVNIYKKKKRGQRNDPTILPTMIPRIKQWPKKLKTLKIRL